MNAAVERTRPDVSVVVASFSGEEALAHCLSAVQACAPSAEVVAATNAPPEAVARLASRFPRVQFIPCARGTAVFELRSVGLSRAGGRTLALLEDHCTPGPEWLGAIREGRQAGFAVVGGPIDNGRVGRVYDWALYLCEYSAYMPPLPEGPTAALLGANAAYDRGALWDCHPAWKEGFYENEVHDALRAAGHALYLAGKARVDSHLAMTLRQAMAHLFAGGRRFGGYRKSTSSRGRRLFWVLAAPLVPLVLLSRIVRRVAARRPARLWTLALGLPYLLCLLLAWSAGEASGYLAACPPGEA